MKSKKPKIDLIKLHPFDKTELEKAILENSTSANVKFHGLIQLTNLPVRVLNLLKK